MAKKLLVIDDSAVVRAMIQKLFQGVGYEVITASDGLEGIRKANSDHPDLIILDVKMPKMSGYQVCRFLKHNKETSQIPILMFTGETGRDDRFYGLSTGADSYMGKDFQPEELLLKVKELLGD